MKQTQERKDMKDYGYANGWKETPVEVRACKTIGHEKIIKTVGRCLTEYSCPVCGYVYKVDSSD